MEKILKGIFVILVIVYSLPSRGQTFYSEGYYGAAVIKQSTPLLLHVTDDARIAVSLQGARDTDVIMMFVEFQIPDEIFPYCLSDASVYFRFEGSRVIKAKTQVSELCKTGRIVLRRGEELYLRLRKNKLQHLGFVIDSEHLYKRAINAYEKEDLITMFNNIEKQY